MRPKTFLGGGEPIRSGTIKLIGLQNEVQVHYDEYAVPHVYDNNETDLYFAAGYIMASERLFQMDMVNRAAQGGIAEMSPGLVSTDPSFRGIYDLSDWDNSQLVIPTGRSGNPFSELYRDQAAMYSSGQYRTIDYSKSQVLENAVSTFVLQP